MPTPPNPDEIAAGASIWLLPSASDTVLLRGIITELSGRFGTPQFEPHLTLAGDLRSGWSAYVPVLDALAQASAAFSQPADNIVLTEAYFRSFYASFGRRPELETLKRVCVSAVGGSMEHFTPHVSLLYGEVAEAEKKEAARWAEQRLHGMQTTFDRVAVTNSSDNVPINEWHIHATRDLRILQAHGG